MTASERVQPFDLIFGELAEERFAVIAQALGDDRSIEAFMLASPGIELLRDLRPEEALDTGIDSFSAFVHAAWHHWISGRPTATLDEATTRRLLENPGKRSASAPVTHRPEAGAMYIQVAPHLIWARVEGAASHEPIDGWFAVPRTDGLAVVACLGVHAARPGLSVMIATGQRPGPLAREGGAELFAPTMDGGDTAGLFEVTSPQELLELAWRAIHLT